jgi:DNA-binding NarL/FixJ family response regulator
MSLLNNLTKQEQTVLALVAQGKRNATIALELYISVRTVEDHLYRVFDKLGVSSRTEAALYVLRIEAVSIQEMTWNLGRHTE